MANGSNPHLEYAREWLEPGESQVIPVALILLYGLTPLAAWGSGVSVSAIAALTLYFWGVWSVAIAVGLLIPAPEN